MITLLFVIIAFSAIMAILTSSNSENSKPETKPVSLSEVQSKEFVVITSSVEDPSMELPQKIFQELQSIPMLFPMYLSGGVDEILAFFSPKRSVEQLVERDGKVFKTEKIFEKTGQPIRTWTSVKEQFGIPTPPKRALLKDPEAFVSNNNTCKGCINPLEFCTCRQYRCKFCDNPSKDRLCSECKGFEAWALKTTPSPPVNYVATSGVITRSMASPMKELCDQLGIPDAECEYCNVPMKFHGNQRCQGTAF